MSEKKISEIQQEYKAIDIEGLPDFIEEYINDGRPGVSKIIGVAQKRMEKLRIEQERIEKLKEYENQ
jgi:ribonuclease HII